MILSVSRRTDIPAFYSEWFFNRIKNGFVCVPNPMNIKQIAKVKIQPVTMKYAKDLFGTMYVDGCVDGIVFWTKNAKPILSRIDELDDFVYYFQYTVNPYNNTIEKNVPLLEDRIKVFIELSKKIGKNKIIWRYDPIFLDKTKDITIEWHVEKFQEIIHQIAPYTDKCIFSFIDITPQIRNSFQVLTKDEMNKIAEEFSRIAKIYKVQLETCAEEIELVKYDILHGHCIDAELFQKLWAEKGVTATRKNNRLDGQRKFCGCTPCVDIGVFDTCCHKCTYCYATRAVQNRKHNKLGVALLDGFDGQIYDRETDLVFEYSKR